jgi:WD40 repeat protein
LKLSELQGTGVRPSDSVTHGYGQWVRNGDYFLIEWSWIDDGDKRILPMFDPGEKRYYDVREMAGISPELTCPQTAVSPDGKYVWVMCYGIDYLVNLSNFETKAYPGYTQVDINWSADSKFAWFESFDLSDNRFEILSISNSKLSPLPVRPLPESPLRWHPSDNVLAFLSEDGQKLELLNPQNISVQELELTIAFSDLVWHPNGDHIALMAKDGSLWKVDYPKLENLEQLTPALPNVSQVNWSPDGNSLAFVSGSDIYIVDTMK